MNQLLSYLEGELAAFSAVRARLQAEGMARALAVLKLDQVIARLEAQMSLLRADAAAVPDDDIPGDEAEGR